MRLTAPFCTADPPPFALLVGCMVLQGSIFVPLQLSAVMDVRGWTGLDSPKVTVQKVGIPALLVPTRKGVCLGSQLQTILVLSMQINTLLRALPGVPAIHLQRGLRSGER